MAPVYHLRNSGFDTLNHTPLCHQMISSHPPTILLRQQGHSPTSAPAAGQPLKYRENHPVSQDNIVQVGRWICTLLLR